MKKRLILSLVLFLLVSSPLAFAQEDTSDSCSGFFGKVKCFLFGDASKRPVAGSAWYDSDSETLVNK